MGRFIISEELRFNQKMSSEAVERYKKAITEVIRENPHVAMTKMDIARKISPRKELTARLPYYIKLMEEQNIIGSYGTQATKRYWYVVGEEPAKLLSKPSEEAKEVIETPEPKKEDTGEKVPVHVGPPRGLRMQGFKRLRRRKRLRDHKQPISITFNINL